MTSKVSVADFEHVESLSVQLDLYGQSFHVGTLAWDNKERRAFFEYHRQFLAEPIALSPFKLAAKEGAIAAAHEPFGGLHGMLNDSLPDGWGRLLLDRSLRKLSYNYRLLTPLDRLARVGPTGMGALRYVPDRSRRSSRSGDVDLDWLVKFKGNRDPAEIGSEEYAYSLMAAPAGVVMPETRLILPRDERHIRQMFTRMVFNVLAHNRDDHAKNHAFKSTNQGSRQASEPAQLRH
jgi:hypothetical protein